MRNRLSLGCVQCFETRRRTLQSWIEAADTEADQRRLHAIDEAAPLAGKALALTVRPLGILLAPASGLPPSCSDPARREAIPEMRVSKGQYRAGPFWRASAEAAQAKHAHPQGQALDAWN
ncbi:MAG: hypothetical protein WBX25_10450 [Rhodomicrobium sp.]